MAFVTAFQVQDLHGRFWNGAEFIRDEDAAEEFEAAGEAGEIADLHDGHVVEFQRQATALEALMLARPADIQSIAAE